MRIKICGMRNLDNVLDAISLGVDAIGFIFVKSSPRYISPTDAAKIIKVIPPFVSTVGVFVNESVDDMNNIAEQCNLDYFQLHGKESISVCKELKRRVIKTIKVSDLVDIEQISTYEDYVSAILLDTKIINMDGGTGQVFDWGIALAAKEKFNVPIILAGGISESNLSKAIQMVNPFAIDLSSGVEIEPGLKSYDKMQSILRLSQTC